MVGGGEGAKRGRNMFTIRAVQPQGECERQYALGRGRHGKNVVCGTLDGSHDAHNGANMMSYGSTLCTEPQHNPTIQCMPSNNSSIYICSSVRVLWDVGGVTLATMPHPCPIFPY